MLFEFFSIMTVKLPKVKWWDFGPEKLVEFLPLLYDPDLKKYLNNK